MKQTSFLWHAAGFAIATLGGTLLHFLYDWTGGNILIAPFSGINESTWEHMKLLFWPLFFLAVIQRLFFKMPDSFWCIKLAGIALGVSLIPVLFYTYNGIFGQSPDWVNITIFYICAAAVFLLEWWLFRQDRFGCKYPQIALAAICTIGILFIVSTFAPPHIPLFQDPITGTYGLES